jgi:chromosome segregation ATPase
MTYAEAAARFRVSAEAARQIALRQKWPRRKSNDDPHGRVQVLVPDDARPRPRTPLQTGVQRSSGGSVRRPDVHQSDTRSSGAVDALREALDLLREQLAHERNRADVAGGQVEAARVRADEYAREMAALRDQLHAELARADLAEQGRDRADASLAAVRADLERVDAVDQRGRGDRLDAENRDLRSRADRAEGQVEQLRQAAKTTERVLREAETALTAERTAKATAEAEAAHLSQAGDQALADAQEARRSAVAETIKLQQARAEAEQAAQAAEAEATRLRQAVDLATSQAEQAVQEAKALREAEEARAAAQAKEPVDRPSIVASRIDEVQLRRLQAAEQARKSLGRLARLRAAWRGE